MSRCFVIQPFDHGKFDKRYHDIFEPAITGAGYDPYRVDLDLGASIPIEEIAKQIGESEVCFAEITLDNPNVWFELGYALASGKEVCLACSNERTQKYPFDVQHRLIVQYAGDSISDYETAKGKIKSRLMAIKAKNISLDKIKQKEVMNTIEGLTHHEISCLCVIMQNQTGPSDEVPHWQIVNDMEQIGYNKLAAQLSLRKLLKRDMIESRFSEGFDRNIGEDYKITLYKVSDIGSDWLIENDDKLLLK